jgi:hypothetical protein
MKLLIYFNKFEFFQFSDLPVLFIQTNLIVWRVFVCLTTFIAFIAIILIGYLITYHIYLSKYKNLIFFKIS